MAVESDDEKSRLSRLTDAIEAYLDHDDSDPGTRDDILDQHLLLHAKPATDPGLDDADSLRRQVEERGDHSPHVERHLGR